MRLSLDAYSAIRPCFCSRTPRVRGAVHRQASSSFCQTTRAALVPANRDVKSLVFPFGRSDRTARSSLIRRKASLINGFNSLLGHNYFPVPLRREFDSKYLISLVLLVKNLDIGSQNR